MSEETKQLTIAEQIDADEGLKSQRRKLVTVSVILMGIIFTDMEVTKANTFFFEMEFKNQNGLALLLAISILFLMIRYFNYASQYHFKFYEKWTSRLLAEDDYWWVCPHSGNRQGLVNELMPKKLDFEMVNYNRWTLKWILETRFGFSRFIRYHWNDENQDYSEAINVLKSAGNKRHFKLLLDESGVKVGSFLIDREQLDIMSPYLLGASSLLALVLSDYLI